MSVKGWECVLNVVFDALDEDVREWGWWGWKGGTRGDGERRLFARFGYDRFIELLWDWSIIFPHLMFFVYLSRTCMVEWKRRIISESDGISSTTSYHPRLGNRVTRFESFAPRLNSLHLHSSQWGRKHLSSAVPSVNENIGSGRVAAGVTAEVDVCTLELLSLAVATHRDHAPPQVLHLLVHEVAQAGVDVTGGDGIDAGESTPLVGQALGHVDAARFGDVVAALLLREVCNVAGHGGRDDQAAAATLAEVRAHGFGAVEGTVQVGLDDIVPFLDRGVQDAAVGGAAGVGDEGVDLAEFLDHFVDQLLHVVVFADVALVGFGLHAILLG